MSDLADAHVHALQHLIANPTTSLTMNCGYGRGFSVLEVLDTVDRVAGTPVRRVMSPRRPGDPHQQVADKSRILATLPWRPKYDDLTGIVADALAWERTLAGRQR